MIDFRGGARLIAAALLFAAAPAPAGQSFSTAVKVTVNLVTSSGKCMSEQARLGVSVVCERPRVTTAMAPGQAGWVSRAQGVATSGLLLQEAAIDEPQAEQPRQMVPMPIGGGMFEALPVRTAGVEIAGWRLVSSDNHAYVELTIAW